MDLVVGADGGGGLEDLVGGRREVSRSAAEQLAKRFQMAYFECSAVSTAFFIRCFASLEHPIERQYSPYN